MPKSANGMSMTSDQILRYVEDPSSLNERTLGELREILDVYPYFQTAHLLYIRNLQSESNFRFAGQLKTCSAYVSDRTILYHLLNPGLAQGVTERLHTVSGTYVRQDLPMIEFSEDGVGNLNVPEDNPIQGTIYPEIGHDDLLNFELSAISYKLEGDENEKEKPLEELARDISNLSSKKQKEKQPEQKSDLIDRFIKDNPAFTVRQSGNPKSDKIVDEQQDMAVEKDEFITETLARIYMNQGLYQKAINAFEKLSLKYPEKNAYFARQIEEITNLINK